MELYLFIHEDIIMEALKRIKYNELSARTIIKYMALKHGWIDILENGIITRFILYKDILF